MSAFVRSQTQFVHIENELLEAWYVREAVWLPGTAGVQADFRVRPHTLTLAERLEALTVD